MTLRLAAYGLQTEAPGAQTSRGVLYTARTWRLHLLKQGNQMLKKILVSFAFATLASTSAFAWPAKNVTLCNKTTDNGTKLVITGGQGEALDGAGRLVGGGTSKYIVPGTCALFMVLQDPPLMWRISVYSRDYRPFTWHKPFNVRTQNKIDITGTNLTGYEFEFSTVP